MKKITALLFFLAFTSFAFGQAQVGDDALDFTIADTHGDSVNLFTELDEGHVVLLDFMASWCGPCAASTPVLADIYADYGSGDGFVHVWAMDIESNDNNADIDALVAQWGKTYPGFAQARYIYDFYYGNSTGYSIPHFAVIGADGKVKYSDSGFGGGTDMTLRNLINANIIPNATVTHTINPNNGVTVEFNSNASLFGETYLWEFGDGGTSTDANPTHTYVTNGTFDVKLTLGNSFVTDIDEETFQVAISNVSVNEVNPNMLGLSVYPSPSNGTFNVKFNIKQTSDVNIKIFNIQGQEVFTKAISKFAGQYANTFDLAKGVYTVQVNSEAGVSTQKVVVVE